MAKGKNAHISTKQCPSCKGKGFVKCRCKGNNDHGINFGCEQCQSVWNIKPNTDNFYKNYAGKLPCSRCSGTGIIERV